MKRRLSVLWLLTAFFGLFSPGTALAQDPYIGEIRMFAGSYAPRGWAFCNGQHLHISGNEALFSLIGCTYGGDCRNDFALPDLRGRAPIHAGQGSGLSYRQLGQKGGQENVTLSIHQIPSHSHSLMGSSELPDDVSPEKNSPAAKSRTKQYASGDPDVTMNEDAISSSGGGQPHNNMPPFIVVNYIIALEGNWPPRP